MATCKTCGNRNPRLPDGWPNWDCLACCSEEYYANDPAMLAKIAKARSLYLDLKRINNEILELEIEVAMERQNAGTDKRNRNY